jgi:hypothetical protein
MKNGSRYRADKIKHRDADANLAWHWRITDLTTDSRIATCYVWENAKLVTKALNELARMKSERRP